MHFKISEICAIINSKQNEQKIVITTEHIEIEDLRETWIGWISEASSSLKEDKDEKSRKKNYEKEQKFIKNEKFNF